MSSKLLKDISSEALVNALNDEKLEVQSSPVYDFVERFDLKSGTSRVPARLLFNIFLKYYPKTLLFEYFNNEASLLLEYDRKRCEYLLNKESKLLHYEATRVAAPRKNTLPNTVALQRHFNTWLEKQNITKGEQGVPWYVLYDVYRSYCIDIKFKAPKAFRTFNLYMKFHFNYFYNGSGPAYFINIDASLLPNKGAYGKLKEKYKITDKKKSI